jgi:hypothetical protein
MKCSFCFDISHNIRKCNCDELCDLVEKTKFYSIYYCIFNHSYNLSDYIQTLSTRKLKGLLAAKRIAYGNRCHQELVRAIVEVYTVPPYSESTLGMFPSRSHEECVSRLSRFHEFIVTTQFGTSPSLKPLLEIFADSGMQFFRFLFGEYLSVSDLIEHPLSTDNMNPASIMINNSDIYTYHARLTVNELYYYQQETGHLSRDDVSRIRRMVDNSFHPDYTTYVRRYIYLITPIIIEMLQELIHIRDGRLHRMEDVVCKQNILFELVRDTSFSSTEECILCCDNICNTVLNCSHIFCMGCISTMENTAKNDHRVKFTCPTCRSNINTVTTNSSK